MMDTKFLGVLFAFCHASVFAFDLSRLPVVQYVVPCRDACEARKIDSACSSRKGFITHVTQYALGSASFLLFPSTATAAGPITAKETDSLGVLVRRALRPKPPKILRQKLTQEFAVLLMRSSYNALDQLDCVAMVGTLSFIVLWLFQRQLLINRKIMALTGSISKRFLPYSTFRI